ncbi:MAG: hypothetical protein KDK99_05945 [Verrucomicrobiales bacterium]|nr:hypothetical protein [Verrucomicrobiales bacterium]
MADFFQPAEVVTLPHLAAPPPPDAALQARLRSAGAALLLPAHADECGRPAFENILRQSAAVPWLTHRIICMNGLPEQRLPEVRADLAQRLSGSAAQAILLRPEAHELQPLWRAVSAEGRSGGASVEFGKGANIWLATAWLLAQGGGGWVISHDCDLVNPPPDLLWRLCLPLVHPEIGLRWVKASYARVAAGRLYGRMTRLLVLPLLRAVTDVLGPTPATERLSAFRYPLAGEFASRLEDLGQLRIAPGWGLEIAMLGEVSRRLPPDALGQVDLGFHYDHRHRPTEGETAGDGLALPAREVARAILREVLRDAEPRAAEALSALLVTRYAVRAEEWRQRYRRVSLANGLDPADAEELACVRCFSAALTEVAAGHDLGPARDLPPPAEWLAAHPEQAELLRQIRPLTPPT